MQKQNGNPIFFGLHHSIQIYTPKHKLRGIDFFFSGEANLQNVWTSNQQQKPPKHTKDANGNGNATTWHGFGTTSTASNSCCGTTIATSSRTTGTTASTPWPVASAAAGVASTVAGDFTLGGGGQFIDDIA